MWWCLCTIFIHSFKKKTAFSYLRVRPTETGISAAEAWYLSVANNKKKVSTHISPIHMIFNHLRLSPASSWAQSVQSSLLIIIKACNLPNKTPRMRRLIRAFTGRICIVKFKIKSSVALMSAETWIKYQMLLKISVRSKTLIIFDCLSPSRNCLWSWLMIG